MLLIKMSYIIALSAKILSTNCIDTVIQLTVIRFINMHDLYPFFEMEKNISTLLKFKIHEN